MNFDIKISEEEQDSEHYIKITLLFLRPVAERRDCEVARQRKS